MRRAARVRFEWNDLICDERAYPALQRSEVGWKFEVDGHGCPRGA